MQADDEKRVAVASLLVLPQRQGVSFLSLEALTRAEGQRVTTMLAVHLKAEIIPSEITQREPGAALSKLLLSIQRSTGNEEEEDAASLGKLIALKMPAAHNAMYAYR
jgi:hypothetical protein